MNCTKCGGKLKITNTYGAGETGRTMRAECEDCGTVHTMQKIIVAVDPGYGEGAAALAKQMKKARFVD